MLALDARRGGGTPKLEERSGRDGIGGGGRPIR